MLLFEKAWVVENIPSTSVSQFFNVMGAGGVMNQIVYHIKAERKKATIFHFQMHFLQLKGFNFDFKKSLKCVFKGPINNTSAFV